MTAAEIVLKIKDKSIKNKETNVAIGYDITILINTNDINGAVKYVEDYFQCEEKIATEAVKMWQEELGEPLSPEQKALNNEAERLNRLAKQNKPKCPTCSSTNVQKIGTGERAVSITMLGIFSKKINKSFKCKNCGYTW
ncbi:MAG: IS1 family transposase [Lachnospiraceae bacterium]|nr:IS1 family transposase [Lachnospiraceae bacterium]